MTARRTQLVMEAEAAFLPRAKRCASPSCIGCRFPEIEWACSFPLYRNAPRDKWSYDDSPAGPVETGRA